MPMMSKGMKAAYALREIVGMKDTLGIEDAYIEFKEDGIKFDMFTALGEAVSDLIERENKDKLEKELARQILEGDLCTTVHLGDKTDENTIVSK